MISGLSHLAREPVVHFLMLALLLFAFRSRLLGAEEEPILIDDALVAGLASANDDRSEEEQIDAFVRGELLVREALRLGLERGDPIVRRRLAMRMKALLAANVDEPSDAELATYLETHAPRFRTPPNFTFVHRFYSSEQRADPDADARAGREGDAFLLGHRVHRLSASELNGRFGSSFGEQLATLQNEGRLEDGVIIQSRFGFHRLEALSAQSEHLPDLPDVRVRVESAWRDEAESIAISDDVGALLSTTPIEERRAR